MYGYIILQFPVTIIRSFNFGDTYLHTYGEPGTHTLIYIYIYHTNLILDFPV